MRCVERCNGSASLFRSGFKIWPDMIEVSMAQQGATSENGKYCTLRPARIAVLPSSEYLIDLSGAQQVIAAQVHRGRRDRGVAQVIAYCRQTSATG